MIINSQEQYEAEKPTLTVKFGVNITVPNWSIQHGKQIYDAVATTALNFKNRSHLKPSEMPISRYGLTWPEVYFVITKVPTFRKSDLGRHISYIIDQAEGIQAKKEVSKLLAERVIDDFLIACYGNYLLKELNALKIGENLIVHALIYAIFYGIDMLKVAIHKRGLKFYLEDPYSLCKDALTSLTEDTPDSRNIVLERNNYYDEGQSSILDMKTLTDPNGDPQDVNELRKSIRKRVAGLSLLGATAAAGISSIKDPGSPAQNPPDYAAFAQKILSENEEADNNFMRKQRMKDVYFNGHEVPKFDLNNPDWTRSAKPTIHDAFAAIESSGHRNRTHDWQYGGMHDDTRAVSSYGLMPMHVLTLAQKYKPFKDSELGKHVIEMWDKYKEHPNQRMRFGSALNSMTRHFPYDDQVMHHHLNYLSDNVDKMGYTGNNKQQAMAYAHRYGLGKLEKHKNNFMQNDPEGYVSKFNRHLTGNTALSKKAMEHRLNRYRDTSKDQTSNKLETGGQSGT